MSPLRPLFVPMVASPCPCPLRVVPPSSALLPAPSQPSPLSPRRIQPPVPTMSLLSCVRHTQSASQGQADRRRVWQGFAITCGRGGGGNKETVDVRHLSPGRLLCVLTVCLRAPLIIFIPSRTSVLPLCCIRLITSLARSPFLRSFASGTAKFLAFCLTS